AAGCKLMKLAYADCPSLGEKTLFSKMVRKQFLDERSQGSLICRCGLLGSLFQGRRYAQVDLSGLVLSRHV
ncbi:hypothetical protein, partial [Cereibacter changlensis]|uniref:hypothetical protein n=1 Tax=Cereibacter changlensis TaxID=402884 RepID=UPI001B809457